MKKLQESIVSGLRDGAWLTAERIRAYSLILVIAYILGLGAWAALSDGWRDRSGTPLGADFLNVYAAGHMADQGQPSQIYDWAAHGAVEHAIIGFDAPYFGWHYPPMFLMPAALLAFLPYGLALLFYLGAGLAAMIAVLGKIAPPQKLSFYAIAAFPGIFVNIGNGQNGFITAALMGAGFDALESQPCWAGFFFGLLSYKPQYFALVPLALIAARAWRALAATAVTACGVALISLGLFGADTWRAFFASTHLTQKIILEQGAAGWNKIQSLFSLVRMWGGGIEAAYLVQGAVAFCAVGAMLYVWSRRAPPALRVAAFTSAALLATPYIMDYDLTVLAVPVAFLAREGCATFFRAYEKNLLAAVWLLPFLARLAASGGVMVTPFVLMMLLVFCAAHAREQRT